MRWLRHSFNEILVNSKEITIEELSTELQMGGKTARNKKNILIFI